MTGSRLTTSVPKLCVGAAPLGSAPGVYGYEVDRERALETLRATFRGGIPFLDTSRNYGLGRSEERIGTVIREIGGLPSGFILSTKLDRNMETGRFDADQARRSFEQSLSALGLDRVSILHLHDPEYAADLTEITRPGGAMDALFRIKEEGLVDAVGLAMGKLDLMAALLFDWPFDTLITHNRFTLVNRSAEPLIDEAHRRGIAVFNAAPYAGGVFAKGADATRRYVYQEASDAQLEPVRAVERICSQYGVPPAAAALQFSTRDPRVTSTICGMSRPDRIQQTLEWASWDIPDAAWEAILALPHTDVDPEADRVVTPD